MGRRGQEIKFCVFVLALQLTSAQSKVFIGRENLDEGLSKVENVANENKPIGSELYDYYNDALEEYAGQRVVDLDQEFEEYGGQQVVDLDEYELALDGISSFATDDAEKNYQDAYEKSGHHALTSPAMELNLRCPDLPSHSLEGNPGLCIAKTCQSDKDCIDVMEQRSIFTPNRGHACCFNGCVLACLPKIDPPKAFDWIDDPDTQKNQQIGNPSDGKLKSLVPISVEDENASEKIRLPGGCMITSKQMEDLQIFRKYDHVEACACKNGEVVCQVKSSTSSPRDQDI